jgi:C-terminal processing protease CtpA/Prc
VRKDYYDPNFHGLDLEARFKEADEKIKQADSLGQILGIIAQSLIDLNDSHTFFMPPPRPSETDYGWQMQMVGKKCYVVAVKPGSDAEAKGLKEGDEIYSIDGFEPTRDNMWKIQYFYNALRPKPGMQLVVIKPTGQEQQLDVMAKITDGKRVTDLTGDDVNDFIRKMENERRLRRHRYHEVGSDLFIWNMPSFDLEESRVDEMAGKFKKSKALILDLRGNGGGYEVTLLRLLGNLFDHDVKVGELKRRSETKPIQAKTRGGDAFAGKLIVLIDSQSGSAAELLARIVQLEKRGIVIGDRSAGAVMRSKAHWYELGVDTVIPYGVSITDADIIMSDGKSLERVGVAPDQIMLATALDMAAKRDLVLSQASQLAGVTLSPEKAGALFPIEWRK